MSNDQISVILTYVLIFMVVILVSLIFAYITIKIKSKKIRNNGIVRENPEELIKEEIQKEKLGSVLDFMSFEKIEDNMIVQKERKKYLMVVECQGVNYDLMSGVEKTGVEQGFLQFLNTLKHPVQLYVQTRSINLEKSIEIYKEKVRNVELEYNKKKARYIQISKSPEFTDKQKQKAFFEMTKSQNLCEYGKDIIRDTEKLSLNKSILSKKYYVIIAYYQDELSTSEIEYATEEIRNIAFSDLYTKSQAVIRTLASCSVKGKILNSIELAELLYMAYNREGAETFGMERALKAGYDKLYSTAPDVFEKRMEELDKEIEKRAMEKAQTKLQEATTEKQKELEKKEKDMETLVSNIAKIIIQENKKYVGNEIANKAIEKIEEEAKEKGGVGNVQEKEKATRRTNEQ